MTTTHPAHPNYENLDAASKRGIQRYKLARARRIVLGQVSHARPTYTLPR